MNPEVDHKVHEENHDDELEFYGDDYLSSKDAKVPRWLLLTYLILPIWGICSFFYFINGSRGWLDPGHWHQLQKAALTTFPTETIQDLSNPE